MTDRELTNEMIKRADDFVEKQKREFAIAELEKIKTDFEEIKSVRNNPYNNEIEYSVSMKELRELFDKHISEIRTKRRINNE